MSFSVYRMAEKTEKALGDHQLALKPIDPVTYSQQPDVAQPKMRVFSSGASRDLDDDKLDYEGFLSPFVEERFAQYMHKHRKTAQGLRDSDNWQKGIPTGAYMKSMIRHTMDAWKAWDHSELAELEELLQAIKFNVNGLTFELLKMRRKAATQGGVHKAYNETEDDLCS